MTMTTTDPIAELLVATARGDRRAFRRLYDQSAPKLFGIMMGILRRNDWAEDALQEAFTRIWRSAARFDIAKGNGSSWIVTIARNAALSALMRRPKDEFAGREEVLMALPADVPDPAEQATATADARGLKACFEELEGDQRQSILMVYFHGLTHREVAAKLRKPMGTVKSWIRRGLIRLRGCLDREVPHA
jgi:RNA polymerase sigma-70 factor (ECF subfamily)